MNKKKTQPRKKNKTLDFESALSQLESLVTTMEKGDISLEDSLKYFEQGIALTRICQNALKEAEQKIQILIEKNDQQRLTEYQNTDQS